MNADNLPFGCHVVWDWHEEKPVFTCRCDMSAVTMPVPCPIKGSHCVLFCGIKPRIDLSMPVSPESKATQ